MSHGWEYSSGKDSVTLANGSLDRSYDHDRCDSTNDDWQPPISFPTTKYGFDLIQRYYFMYIVFHINCSRYHKKYQSDVLWKVVNGMQHKCLSWNLIHQSDGMFWENSLSTSTVKIVHSSRKEWKSPPVVIVSLESKKLDNLRIPFPCSQHDRCICMFFCT